MHKRVVSCVDTGNSWWAQLVCVDFTATWCGPCQRIGPEFVKMADKYTDCVFIKVDVDENEVSFSFPYHGDPLYDNVSESWMLTCSMKSGCRRHQPRAASNACPPSNFTRTDRRWPKCLVLTQRS